MFAKLEVRGAATVAATGNATRCALVAANV
jgi:hypothetical protein